jgi:hypothetical protein
LAFGSMYMPVKYTQCATSEECLNSLAINHVVILGYRYSLSVTYLRTHLTTYSLTQDLHEAVYPLLHPIY